MTPAAGRLTWVDIAKGIGIALVVVGHDFAESSSTNALWTRDVIYLFHMPLFFIVSGYFAKAGPVAPYARQRLDALFVPYLCYLFLIGVPVALATHQLHGRSAWLEFALFFFGGQHLVTYMTVFWFVTCLFFAQIIYRAMQRISTSPHDWRVLGVMGACCLFSYAVLPRLHLLTPLDVAMVPMALLLMWFGQIYRAIENKPPIVLGACLLAVLGLGIYLRNHALYAYDMKSGVFGPFLPGLSTAVGLSWLVFEFSKALSRSSLATACISPLGRASLTIMFLSEPIRRVLISAGASEAVAIASAIVLPAALHTLFGKSQLLSRLLLGQTMPAAIAPRPSALA